MDRHSLPLGSGGHAIALQLALQSLSPRGIVAVVGDEGEILLLLFFFVHCFVFYAFESLDFSK